MKIVLLHAIQYRGRTYPPGLADVPGLTVAEADGLVRAGVAEIIDQTPPPPNANEIKALVAGMEDSDELAALLDEENSRDRPRKTVVDAITARMAELEAAAQAAAQTAAPAPDGDAADPSGTTAGAPDGTASEVKNDELQQPGGTEGQVAQTDV